MARVPYVDPHPPKDLLQEMPLSDSNITRALSNSRNAAYYSGAMARYIRNHSSVDPRLREMAIIQVGYLARSAYEYVHHLEIGLASGVTEADIRAIADETAGRQTSLDPVARTVLRAAREMTDGVAVTDETFAALRETFDDERLVDLLMAIANYNGVVRILESLAVDVEPDYQAYLERFPLPA